MTKYLWVAVVAAMMILACGGNNAPIIGSVTADPTSTYPGETSDITCNASDEDGDVITYNWTAEDGDLSSTTSSAVVWTAPDDTGTYTITVVVTDDGELTDTGSVDIEVEPNWIYGENMTSVPIYDFTVSWSEIDISGVPSGAEVDSVAIAVSINHTYPSDLEISLESPDGTVLLIWDNTFPGGTEMAVTGAFAGENVNGTWTLYVYDEYQYDEGTLNGWNISVLWKL